MENCPYCNEDCPLKLKENPKDTDRVCEDYLIEQLELQAGV